MGGSLTSVATVKEILPEPAPSSLTQMVQPAQDPTSSTGTTTPLPMDITEDLGQIYDDVMQCVYDDVDVKYDDLVQLGDAGVEKPLPGVPRNKIISKIEEKKNEIILLREKEAEKKKQLEEQKRKEREALEEQKRLERKKGSDRR